MQLIIGEEDIRRLSPTCRAELARLLFGAEGAELLAGGGSSDDEDAGRDSEEVFNEEKKVVDLTPEAAVELLANLKNTETLKLFAAGQAVTPDQLIGEGKPYKRYIDLKKSLVGAVNRRLRTVLGDRNAVLFSSDRQKQRIRVTAKTARSLRRAFNMDEPLPPIEVVDAHGRAIAKDSPEYQELTNLMVSVWGKQAAAGLPIGEDAMWVYAVEHFVTQGFHLYAGFTESWDTETMDIAYEILRAGDPQAQIAEFKTQGLRSSRCDQWFLAPPNGPSDLFVAIGGW